MSDPRTPSTSSSKAPRSRKGARKGEAAPSAQNEPAPDKAVSAESSPIRLQPFDRSSMIAMAAYYRAERRRFEPGHELEDWLGAEREVDAVLMANAAERDS
jgi:hypothetical protein